jgi:hypothetical protein
VSQKKLITRTDASNLLITVDGIDYPEAQRRDTRSRRRLPSQTGG